MWISSRGRSFWRRWFSGRGFGSWRIGGSRLPGDRWGRPGRSSISWMPSVMPSSRSYGRGWGWRGWNGEGETGGVSPQDTHSRLLLAPGAAIWRRFPLAKIPVLPNNGLVIWNNWHQHDFRLPPATLAVWHLFRSISPNGVRAPCLRVRHFPTLRQHDA